MRIQACRALAAALVAGGVVALTAQSSEPGFDVVSIKRNVSGAFPVGPEARRGGSFVAISTTLENVVRFAYDLPGYRVAGGPDWVRSAKFDIEARAARDLSADQIKTLVQAMLKDRFQLVSRLERREGTVYTLWPARDDKRLGPNLRPAAAGCAAPTGPGAKMEERRTPNGGVATKRTCATMAVLTSILADSLQAPVEDKTSLMGVWDYELSFTGPRRRTASAAAAAQDSNDAPVLATAVQDQLGLKLDAGRGAVDVLVIESAAQPSEN
jgi:uncharacterized protein (TIGR03435 family)